MGATTPENILREIRVTLLALAADASIVWETHEIFYGTIFHGVGAPIPENIIKRNGVDCVDPWDIYNHRGGNLWFFFFFCTP